VCHAGEDDVVHECGALATHAGDDPAEHLGQLAKVVGARFDTEQRDVAPEKEVRRVAPAVAEDPVRPGVSPSGRGRGGDDRARGCAEAKVSAVVGVHGAVEETISEV
jgi:hypothetical protein